MMSAGQTPARHSSSAAPYISNTPIQLSVVDSRVNCCMVSSLYLLFLRWAQLAGWSWRDSLSELRLCNDAPHLGLSCACSLACLSGVGTVT